MILTTLTTALLLTQYTVSEGIIYPADRRQLTLPYLRSLNVLEIVRPTGRVEENRKTFGAGYSESGYPLLHVVDLFDVAHDPSPGSGKVRSVFPLGGWRGDTRNPALSPERVYLLAGRRPESGRLSLGQIGRHVDHASSAVSSEVKHLDEVSGVILRPMAQPALSQSKDPVARLLLSVSRCLRGGDDDTVRRAVGTLWHVLPIAGETVEEKPWDVWYREVLVPRAIEDSGVGTPYAKALALVFACGRDQSYYDRMLGALEEADRQGARFHREEDAYRFHNIDMPDDVKDKQLGRWFRIAVEGRDPVLRWYALRSIHGSPYVKRPPAVDQIEKLVKGLAESDDEYRRELLPLLGDWSGRSELEYSIYGHDTLQQTARRKELVEFWLTRWSEVFSAPPRTH